MTTKHGYGSFYVARLKRQLPAHRVAYTIAHGSIPGGLYVLHSCDNPPCVNPAHLRAGTREDNSDDMDRRHRRYRKTQGNRKLTQANVQDIRRRAASGETYGMIAERYSITETYTGLIVRRKAWADLPDAGYDTKATPRSTNSSHLARIARSKTGISNDD